MPLSRSWQYLPSSRAIQSHLLYIITLLCLLSDATTPGPLAVPVDTTSYYGFDGAWSGVQITVGPPETALSLTVFPNTASQETWVIGPDGCDGTFTCQQKRGGLYFKNESTSWVELGQYALNFDPQLGDSGNADYGLDNITLTNQPSLGSQIIGILTSTELWLGELGLGVKGTEFAGTEKHLTFLSSMVEEAGLIPSHSYGYTAGAYYRSQLPASLTLGGVDTNRFVHNPATFPLSSSQQPVISVNEISVSCAPDESVTTLPRWAQKDNSYGLLNASQAGYFTIDSSTPFLWLPEVVCDSFAEALNLTYNDTLGVYLFGDGGTTPDLLTSWNMTFLFSISDKPGSANSVNLELSYNAFNLDLSYPFPNLDANFTSPPVPYFPLRRAVDSTQYTIGRAFLQETYLAVDYERNNFSISQATFSADALTNTNLVAIPRPANSNYTGPPESSTTSAPLSTGAKAGIGIGAAVGALLIIALTMYFCIIKKKKSTSEKDRSSNAHSPRRSLLSRLGVTTSSTRTSSEQGGATELLGDKRQPAEVSADSSNSRFELPTNAPIEMAAADVPISFFAAGQAGDGTHSNSNTSRNDPRNPAELEPMRKRSIDKGIGIALFQEREQQTSPIPPAYSREARRSQRFSASNMNISPNSPRGGGFGTMSSGEQGISPVGDGNSSGRGSSRRSPLSPMSPMDGAGTMRFPQLHGGMTDVSSSNSNSESGTGNSNSLRVPLAISHEVVAQPERSMSRGSRFVEEGLDDEGGRRSESGSRQEKVRRLPLSKRFSWED